MSKKSKVSKLGYSTNTLESEITEIFEKVQKSQAIHNDCSKKLQKLLGEDSNISFRSVFLEKIQHILLVPIQKRDDEETVERLMTFLTTFSCNVVATNREFFDDFIDSILTYVNVKEKGVRYRSCHLISLILARLARSDSPFKFDEDAETKILGLLSERLADKMAQIRLFVVQAFSFFYNQEDSSDFVTECYLQFLSSDSSVDVRKCILNLLKITPQTVNAVVQRCRDVDPTVRRAALDVVAEKISIKRLPSETVLQILLEGTKDKESPLVVEGVKSVLKAWYKESGNRTKEFLKHCDVEHYEMECEQVLYFLFSTKIYRSDTENIKDEGIDEELTLFWRVYCCFIKESETAWSCDEIFTSLLPQITVLCQLLQKFDDNSFIMSQLLQICLFMDYSDEAGRKVLSKILLQRLSETRDEKEIKLILDVLLKIDIRDQDEFVRITLDVIANLSEEQADPRACVVMLRIATYILENTQQKASNPGMTDLLNTVILPSISSDDEEIKISGIKCFGLFCLLDKALTIQHLSKFITVVQEETSVKPCIVALTSLFDFVVQFGPISLGDHYSNKGFSKNKKDSKSISITELLLKQMNDINEEKRTACVNGFCKLFCLDVIQCESILTALIIEKYNPLTQRFPQTRECLFWFFQTFAGELFPIDDKDVRKAHRLLMDKSLIMAITSILSEEENSFLGKIKLKEMIQFFFDKSYFGEDNERQIAITKELLHLVASVPLGRAGKELPLLISSLNAFGHYKEPSQVSKKMLEIIKSIRLLLSTKCIPYVNDKHSTQALIKLKEKLDVLDPSPLENDAPIAAVTSATPKSKPINKSVSDILEAKRLEFNEMDKFQLATQIVTPNGKSRSKKTQKDTIDFNEIEMMQLFGTLESKIVETGNTQTKTEISSIIEKLKSKYLQTAKKESVKQSRTPVMKSRAHQPNREIKNDWNNNPINNNPGSFMALDLPPLDNGMVIDESSNQKKSKSSRSAVQKRKEALQIDISDNNDDNDFQVIKVPLKKETKEKKETKRKERNKRKKRN